MAKLAIRHQRPVARADCIQLCRQFHAVPHHVNSHTHKIHSLKINVTEFKTRKNYSTIIIDQFRLLVNTKEARLTQH